MEPVGNSTGETAPAAASSRPDEAQPVADAADIELLRRIEGGDEESFRTLVDRHGKYLYGVAHALLGNSADVEDVVQETFVAVIKGRFRAESSVRTWLVRILVKRAAMFRRSWFRKRSHDRPMESASQAAVGDTGGAEAKLDLTTMLATLSVEHRAVIVLRELEGMSYEEMAAALGVPRGTVESRLHRAREELRRKFKGYL